MNTLSENSGITPSNLLLDHRWLELRLRLYRKIYSNIGQVETRCRILARVLGVGFSSCAVPTFSDSPSISNTTWAKIRKVGIGSYKVGIQMS